MADKQLKQLTAQVADLKARVELLETASIESAKTNAGAAAGKAAKGAAKNAGEKVPTTYIAYLARVLGEDREGTLKKFFTTAQVKAMTATKAVKEAKEGPARAKAELTYLKGVASQNAAIKNKITAEFKKFKDENASQETEDKTEETGKKAPAKGKGKAAAADDDDEEESGSGDSESSEEEEAKAEEKEDASDDESDDSDDSSDEDSNADASGSDKDEEESGSAADDDDEEETPKGKGKAAPAKGKAAPAKGKAAPAKKGK